MLFGARQFCGDFFDVLKGQSGHVFLINGNHQLIGEAGEAPNPTLAAEPFKT